MSRSLFLSLKYCIRSIFVGRCQFLFVIVLLVSVSGCSSGGGGGDESAPPVVLSGQVLAPGGQVASLNRATFLASVVDLFIPAAQAVVSGLLPVADGTQVDLVRVNDAGSVETLIASTTITAGRYRFDLTALNLAFANDLMVQVSGFGVQMRAFVTDEGVDIDPVSEAVSRWVFDTIAATPAALLENFTVAELQALYASANLLTSLDGATPRVDVESTVTAVTDLLAADSDISAFLAAAAAPGQSSTGLGDAENLFPLDQGDRWSYVVEASEQTAPYFSAISVSGEKVVNGMTTTTVSESNPDNSGVPTEEYLKKSDQTLFNHGNSDPEDTLTPLLVPYPLVTFPVSPGDSETLVNRTGLVWPEDLDGDGKNESFSTVATATNSGVESVTLPLATFAAALRRDIELKVEVRLSGQGEIVTSTSRVTEWHVPDVGLIKSSETISAQGPAGTVVDTETRVLRGYQVNGTGAGFLPAFAVAEDLAVANSDSNFPGQPGLGFDGQNYLVVTCREDNGSGLPSGVVGLFVSTDGTVSSSFTIAQHPCYGFSAAVAFDGENYLVVFQRYSDGSFGSPGLFATRVTPAGDVLDTDGFAVSSGSETTSGLAIAFDGTNFLVVYGKYQLNGLEPTLWDIYAARVSPVGAVLGEFPVMVASGDQLAPSVAFDGTNYMVVWEHTAGGSGPSEATDTYAARISPAGVVLDPAGIAVANSAGYQGEAHITFGGGQYFIVWIEVDSFFLYPPQSRIYGRRVGTDGTLLDGSADTSGIDINTTVPSKADLDVEFNGSNYLVVWRMANFSNDPPAGVYGARVSIAGPLLDGPADSDGLVISGTPPDFSLYVHPVLLFNGSHSLMLWNNNIELSGELKSLEGMFVYPF